jgi:hypothetical protein
MLGQYRRLKTQKLYVSAEQSSSMPLRAEPIMRGGIVREKSLNHEKGHFRIESCYRARRLQDVSSNWHCESEASVFEKTIQVDPPPPL